MSAEEDSEFVAIVTADSDLFFYHDLHCVKAEIPHQLDGKSRKRSLLPCSLSPWSSWKKRLKISQWNVTATGFEFFYRTCGNVE